MPSRPPTHEPMVWRPPQAQRARQGDPFYQSKQWKSLRLACLIRDCFTCRLRRPGCRVRATIAHHVIDRRKGGPDILANLIASCSDCHNAAHPEKGYFA